MVEEKRHYDEKGIFDGYLNRLLCADLDSGEIVEIEDETYTKTKEYDLIGFRDGQIYYQYRAGDKYPDGALICLDCDTKEKETLVLEKGRLGSAQMNETYLMYTLKMEDDWKVIVVDLESGEEIANFVIGEDMLPGLYKNEILMSSMVEGYSRYDLETGKAEKLGDGAYYAYFWAQHATGSGYLGQISEDGVYTEYAYISKEDFDQGREAKILTKNGWPIW